jgi:hypothetical protein
LRKIGDFFAEVHVEALQCELLLPGHAAAPVQLR